MYNYCCANFVVQILLYEMQCALFSNCVLKIILDALFEFKSKGKYERKMLNRLKRNFKRKNYINSFCLMPQVLFFFSADRWTNGKRMKKNKSCLKMWCYKILQIQGYKMWKQSLFHCCVNEEKWWINCWRLLIDQTSCSTHRCFSSTCKWYLLFVNDNFVEK